MRSVFNEPKNDNNSKTPKIHKLNKPLIVSCETILSLKLYFFFPLLFQRNHNHYSNLYSH